MQNYINFSTYIYNDKKIIFLLFTCLRLGLMTLFANQYHPNNMFLPTLQQLQHHRFAVASTALSSPVSGAGGGGQGDSTEPDGIRNVLRGGGSVGWSFPWRPPHGFQTLEHHTPSDVVNSLNRSSPTLASYPHKGE